MVIVDQAPTPKARTKIWTLNPPSLQYSPRLTDKFCTKISENTKPELVLHLMLKAGYITWTK